MASTNTDGPTPSTFDSEFDDLEAPVNDEGDGGDNKKNRWKKIVKEGLVVPYREVHAPPASFKTPNRRVFIPGKPVHARIVDVERTVSTHLLNPNLYVIQMTHGPFTWTIKRRYKHFQHLHQQLQLYRVALSVPIPTKTHRERRSSYKTSVQQIVSKDEDGKTVGTSGLLRFPRKPEALVTSHQIEERRASLEQYLQGVLKIRAFRNHHETLEFLEVSHLSFVLGLGDKGKEGIVQKRAGTTHTRRACGICTCVNHPFLRFQRLFGDCFGQWQKRWLIVKDTFVAYVRPKDGRLHCVMLADPEFDVSSGLYGSGTDHGIIISNSSRQLILKCWTKRRSKEWLDYLRKFSQNPAARSFIESNRFSSYAPIRTKVDAQWFVDGSTYFAAIADALEGAQEEILIADWWLSPEIYMKRPIVEGEKWRLDNILQRKARDGVKIFVLLYKEVNLALGINSFYSKQKLVEKHPDNIKVLRHPDHVSAGVLLWAHHEKLVIVDQTYAFVGGIDLCYGRWDDYRHTLTDLGSVSTQQRLVGVMQQKMTSSKPGGGLTSFSILHLAKAANSVTIGTVVHSTDSAAANEDDPASTVKKEEEVIIEEINEEEILTEEGTVTFTSSNTLKLVPNGEDEAVAPVENKVPLKGESDEETPMKGETPPTGRKKFVSKVTKVTKELKEDGRDWVNRHIRRKDSQGDSSASEAEKEEEHKSQKKSDSTAMQKRSRTKRNAEAKEVQPKPEAEEIDLQGSSKLWMGKDYTNFIVKDFSDLESPFTDLVDRSTTPRMPWHDIGMMVQGTAARDVARHFIQRWNAVKNEKVPVNHSYPFLLPKSYDFENDSVPPLQTRHYKPSKINCQVVRSVSEWSSGLKILEDSIQQAYVESIENAKHYIYFENQFFITLSTANQNVQNRIGEALLQRILRADREGTCFRVFVVIPLLPGFEGEVGTSRGVAIHAITHWNYSSICRGPDALLVRLKKAGIEDPSKYVTFHGLRTHSELHGDLVTELIYVHSKLLIVDDNLVICGSANINDRSMTGKRDSEVCVVIQDEEFRPARMNKQEYNAGKFAQSLRKRLFREHLGYIRNKKFDLSDPISDEFYRDVWIQTSKRNTEIYDKVFRCVPTDNVKTFAQMATYQYEHPLAASDHIAAKAMLRDVKGHLVDLPMSFLKEEYLLPGAGTKEGLFPTQLWT